MMKFACCCISGIVLNVNFLHDKLVYNSAAETTVTCLRHLHYPRI